jgi:cyanate permease
MASSGFLRVFAVNHLTLFLAVVLFGLGGPFVSIGAPKLISAWFGQRDRGTAMGICLTAPSVGRIIALSTANSVLMPLFRSSWRLTLSTYAAVAVLVGIFWWIIAREPVEAGDEGSTSGGNEESRNLRTGFLSGFRVFPALLKNRLVRIVLIFSFGSFFFMHAFSSWLPEILRVGGMTTKQAGYWATIPVVVGLLTTLIVPRVAVPKRRIPILFGILVAASASAVMLGTTTVSLKIVGMFVVGMVGRAVMPILMLILMDSPRVGSIRMGSAGGLFFTAGEVGGVSGPLLLGIASDLTGGFGWGLTMLSGLTASLAFLVFWLRREVRRGSSEPQ